MTRSVVLAKLSTIYSYVAIIYIRLRTQSSKSNNVIIIKRHFGFSKTQSRFKSNTDNRCYYLLINYYFYYIGNAQRFDIGDKLCSIGLIERFEFIFVGHDLTSLIILSI